MRKRPVKITDSVVNQMRILRSHSKTNREIAEALNISIASVHRHIGDQPDGLKADYGSVVTRVTDIAEPKPVVTAIKKSSLRLIAQTKIMEGNYYHFSLDSLGNITITVKRPEEKIRLDRAGMENYITELMDAYVELCQCAEGKG